MPVGKGTINGLGLVTVVLLVLLGVLEMLYYQPHSLHFKVFAILMLSLNFPASFHINLFLICEQASVLIISLAQRRKCTLKKHLFVTFTSRCFLYCIWLRVIEH